MVEPMRIGYLADFPAFMRELASWHQAAWGHLEPGESVDKRAQDFARYGDAGSFPTALVAHEAGQLLGSALLLPEDLAIRPHLTPWLAGVYVREDRRGQGLASALVREAIEEARRQRLPQLWLYTPYNESLYARLGFETREQTRFHGEAITLMQLALTHD